MNRIRPGSEERNVRAVLHDAASRLAAISDTPRLDAELLMAHALGVERETLLLDPTRFAVPETFAGLVARRLAREPVAYIIGHRDFWTVRLRVGPGVLIPRPDSETLIEACLDFAQQARGEGWPRTVLDLGTGPGTLLLASLSEWPDSTGLGVDSSETALDYARSNAAALGLAGRAEFRRGDWGEGLADCYDLILCNPPYIAESEELMPDVADHEPAEALFAGVDGLADYRRLIPDLARLLAPGGAAVLEIGATQLKLVGSLAEQAGFAVQCRKDLAGRDRAVLLTPAA
ncbi:release factor glutamine methyltransferase [Sphingopyxis flava]|uniref:Release factor glutamine methyltransferase n=1 Tax=Sphingopyxis flava TaxID=1507287 RepID=A0A1T5ATP7_9SPHN|nr:release factor glutamine methyltransferase [Sphingopyxis flava]